MKEKRIDSLLIKQFETRKELGAAAAAEAGIVIQRLLDEKSEISIIFAAAPSQNEFLDALVQNEHIDFTRINAFHMDEYIGLSSDAPQGFGNFLKAHLFSRVPFKSISYINGQTKSPQQECARYTALLKHNKPDIVCMGIGENAHIAFNDPHVAHFDDNEAVKIVTLDETCRQQQVNDGCFQKIEDVPTHAITLTIPSLLAAEHFFCMVPAKTKAQAVLNVCTKEISESYPASVLRKCKNATMYLDAQSGSLLNYV